MKATIRAIVKRMGLAALFALRELIAREISERELGLRTITADDVTEMFEAAVSEGTVADLAGVAA